MYSWLNLPFPDLSVLEKDAQRWWRSYGCWVCSAKSGQDGAVAKHDQIHCFRRETLEHSPQIPKARKVYISNELPDFFS